MPRKLAFALVLAAAGCDASLGGDGSGGDAAISDGTRVDSSVADAATDARVCGGGTAALAPDGSCLVHVTTPATYAAAKSACMTMMPGGHLAWLKTAQLDTFAESFIGTVDTWIGGNDLVTEGTFQWDDGTAFAFTNWHTGEPNNGGTGATYQEDCVIVAGSRVGKQWDDRPCDAIEVPTSGMFAYLCQY